MTDVNFRNHPNLVKNWDRYRKIADFEDGDVERVLGYLWQYGFEKEPNDKAKAHYASRVERLHNDNFVEQYLRLHLGHMSQPITLSGVDESDRLKLISKDVTGFGMSSLVAARERLRLYVRDGRVGTLVDSPKVVRESKVEAQAEREQSYQVIYEATQIRYWERFTAGPRRGQLKLLVLDAEPYVENGRAYESFRRYEQPELMGSRYQWQHIRAKNSGLSVDGLTDKEIECVVIPGEEGDGGVDGIPFIVWGEGPRESFVRAVVQQNCTHMNLLSVRDNVLWYTGMQRNAFVGVTPEELDKWAESAALMIRNENAKIFTVEGFDPVGLNKALERSEKHIHRHGKFQYNQLADDTRQVQAAESKELDLKVQKDIYDKTLDRQAEVEREIWRWHARYEKADADKIEVSIGRDYGFDDAEAEEAERQAIWSEARELGATKTLKQILKGRVLRMVVVPEDGKTEEDTRKELLDEIDAAQPGARSSSSLLGQQGRGLFQNLPPVTNG